MPAGDASGAAGGVRNLSITPTSAMTSFIAANPAVRCEFWATFKNGTRSLLKGGKCSAAGALAHSFTYSGTNTNISTVQFIMHSADFRTTTWTVY